MTKTTFISLNGQLVEVSVGSSEALSYAANAVTDIGDPDNVASFTLENPDETSNGDTGTESPEVTPEPTATPEPTSTPEPTVTPEPGTEEMGSEAELLSDAVELLAENSTTVTGTINTTVLGLMDRIIDDYPDYYEYAGFRIDSDDAYRATLYISKHGSHENGTITFGDDCIAVDFYRYSNNYASSYVYYEITDTPEATVDISTNTIVYTDVIDGYPALGTRTPQTDENIWLGFFALGMLIIFLRRKNHA